MRRPWTAEEDQILRDRYPTSSARAMAELLGRTLSAVQSRTHKLRIHQQPRWTAVDRRALRAGLSEGRTYETLARELDRSRKAVKHEALAMGLAKGTATRVTWTPAMEAFLLAHYAVQSAAWIADQLGATRLQVQNKVRRLGLRKRGRLTPQAEAVLWELRDQEGVIDYVAKMFDHSRRAIQRHLEELERRGGPARPAGNGPAGTTQEETGHDG